MLFRTGEVFTRENVEEPDFRWMGNMPSWCFPKKLITLGRVVQFMDVLHYGKKTMLKEVSNASKVYVGTSLSVSQAGRGKGLGKELIRRSMDWAKNNDCSHMYIYATGIYSQAIFDKIG